VCEWCSANHCRSNNNTFHRLHQAGGALIGNGMGEGKGGYEDWKLTPGGGGGGGGGGAASASEDNDGETNEEVKAMA